MPAASPRGRGSVATAQQSRAGAPAASSVPACSTPTAAKASLTVLSTSPRQQLPLGFEVSQLHSPALTFAVIEATTVLRPVRPISSRMPSTVWPKQ
jgi:hypothetical protein